MKIIFMGTPDFAINSLEALVKAEHQVCLVITQPDKPKGRGKKVLYTPVKEMALQYDLPILQPESIQNEEVITQIKNIKPDVIVVVAFGQILSEDILNIPKHGCINVHASLLPAYRGAAPIQWAVIDGLTESGITTMYMDKGLDTGDMIEQTVVQLSQKETGGSYFDKLAKEGAILLLSTLEKLENQTAVRIKQDHSKSSYAKMLNKAMGQIDFTKTAQEIERLIRGLNPWPGAYTTLGGKILKIFDADIMSTNSDEKTDVMSTKLSFATGEILAIDKHSFTVQCGEDCLKILNLQPEGKKRMDVADFLLGHSIKKGIRLGE